MSTFGGTDTMENLGDEVTSIGRGGATSVGSKNRKGGVPGAMSVTE